ncbi:MAG: amidohydrolase family protein [Synergistales bacterium]|nr:amidohydrolase family protein [Synergistales bacterium]
MTTTVFTNALLLDGTGAEPRANATVTIEGNTIAGISFGGTAEIPAGADVVDCGGRTLMPGLIDAHMHAGLVEANLVEQARMNYPSMLVIKAANILTDTLYQGFTTCRDAGGSDAGFKLAIEEGLIEGPRLQVAGPSLAQTGGHADMRLPTEYGPPHTAEAGFSAMICDGVAEVRKCAREVLRRGADFIKIMASGGCGSAADDIGDSSQFSLEEMRAAVFEAESAGTYVSAHCYTNRGARLCAEAGVRIIEHGNRIDRPTAEILKEAGCIIIPTLSTYELAVTRGKEFNLPDYFQRKMGIVRETALEAVKIAHELGIVIGSGSDVIGPFQPWKGLELELKSRVMGPMGAIVSATKTNAEIMGLADKIGTIAEGKLADCIVVDDSPLDNIAVFQDHKKKMPVILKDGVFYKKEI